MLKFISTLFLRFIQFAVLADTPLHASESVEGLVAYYPFNGKAEDESGNGNHASVFGAMIADDKFGNTRSAYYFDGSKDHMVAPICIGPSVMPQVTMVVWARAEQKDRIATLFADASSKRRNRALLMRPSLGKGGCWATSTNSTGSWVWDKVEIGEWTFLAISYDQSLKKLYLHVNDRKHEADCSQIDGDINLSIGKDPLTGQYFQGYLDEIRVYDRILNGDEIATLYRQFLHGKNAGGSQEFMRQGRRRGLFLVFATGFSLFAGIVLTANIMIRRRSMRV